MSAGSGIKVKKECVDAFDQMKSKHKFQWMSLKINADCTEVEIEKTCHKNTPEANYGAFCDTMKSACDNNECRYGVYDYTVTTQEGQQNDKLVFILWAPETARIKQKMIYSSTKDALKNQLTPGGAGIAAEIQACDFDELSEDTVCSKLHKK